MRKATKARVAALARAIDNAGMTDRMKEWMKDRWLDQVKWFDGKAELANNWYYSLRIVAICGGVMVPALISLDASHADSKGDVTAPWWAIKPATIIISLIVAIAVGLDSFFHWGERWRRYRRTAELLLMEGWLFLEGAGHYSQDKRSAEKTEITPQEARAKVAHEHERNFSKFAETVERIIHHDVESYLAQVATPPPQGETPRSGGDDNK